MTNYIIDGHSLTLARGENTLLNNCSFQVRRGEQILLTGASASGKSSLALALAGNLYISGKVQFNFTPANDKTAKVTLIEQYFKFKDNFGSGNFYYQQRYNSYDADNTPTVAQSINYSVSNSTLNYLLDILHLTHRLNAPLIQLSSGERKKLQLILALAKPSQIIILDNPFIGIDAASKNNLINHLSGLANNGITFILIDDSKDIPSFINTVMSIENQSISKIPVSQYKLSHQKMDNQRLSISINLPEPKVEYSNIIKFDNVNIAYGQKQVLQNLSWQVATGEKWLLQGVNGAGKSTLLSLINGDHPQAYANKIELFGKPRGSGETIWDIKRQIGYVSPELHWNFNTSMSCLNTILSGFFDTIGLYRHATEEQISQARNYLEQLNLQNYADKALAQVSAGIQRIMLLLRALVKNPPLFIFDEPCQGLDDAQSKFFVDLIDQLFATSKHTIIYVSHREDQIPRCINKILKLKPITN